MLTKIMVLLVAGSALTGCCASGTGCSTTQTAGAPIAWDGLGEPPTADDAPGEEKRPAKRKTARNREIILGPLNGAPPREPRTPKRATTNGRGSPTKTSEADARLARQTKICKGC